MKETTAKFCKEARERREQTWGQASRKVMADIHRVNRNKTFYKQTQNYAHARAQYLMSINY